MCGGRKRTSAKSATRKHTWSMYTGLFVKNLYDDHKRRGWESGLAAGFYIDLIGTCNIGSTQGPLDKGSLFKWTQKVELFANLQECILRGTHHTMLLQLPYELLLEVVSRLDLETLIGLLLAFPELLVHVRYYRDFDETSLNSMLKVPRDDPENPYFTHQCQDNITYHTLRRILPSLKSQSWANMASVSSNAYRIKIVEVRLETLLMYDSNEWTWGPSVKHPAVMCRRIRLFIARNFNKLTFVRLIGSAAGYVFKPRDLLSQVCEETGAKLHEGILKILDFPETLDSFKILYESRFPHLTTVRINGRYAVSITRLPNVIDLFVELEARPHCRRGSFRLEYAPRLKRLTVHYKGEWVPRIHIGEEVFYRYEGDNTRIQYRLCDVCSYKADHGCFELKRISTGGGAIAASHDDDSCGSRYISNVVILPKACRCLTFDGVPDWVLMMCHLKHVQGLSWARWRTCGRNLFSPDIILKADKLAKLVLITDVGDFVIPRFEIWFNELSTLQITSYAYGLNIDGIFTPIIESDLLCCIRDLTIICPDYHPEKDALTISKDALDKVLKAVKHLHLQGHLLVESIGTNAPDHLPDREPIYPPSQEFRDLTVFTMDITASIMNASQILDKESRLSIDVFIEYPYPEGLRELRYLQLTTQRQALKHIQRPPMVKIMLPQTSSKTSYREVLVDDFLQRMGTVVINEHNCVLPETDSLIAHTVNNVHCWRVVENREPIYFISSHMVNGQPETEYDY